MQAPKSKEEYDFIRKVIIIGDSGVGKSNIFLRFNENRFVENYMLTIGINYAFKVIKVEENVRIKLQIWDTAGQDKYKTVTKGYYKNSDAALVVFSIDNRESFDSVHDWITQLTEITDSLPVVLVGNKMDLEESRQVSYEDAQLFAVKNNVPYLECSAKSGESVEWAFLQLGKMLYERILQKQKLAGEEEEKIQKIRLVKPLNMNIFHEKCCSSER